MTSRTCAAMIVLCVGAGLATLQGGAVSRQQADAFARKIDVIGQHGSGLRISKAARTERRTPVTESEINSWFAYHGADYLPEGLTRPSLTIHGRGQVSGQATVDLDAVARTRASGGLFDPWNLVGGRLPVTMAGVVRTRSGRARFELQTAEIAGIPVPRRMVQEIVSYYSRTPRHPQGRRLDDEFELPAGIQTIELTAGNAVVVQ